MCKLYFSRRAALAEELTLLKQVDQFSFNGLSPGRGEDCSRVPPMSPNARLAITTSLENMLSSFSDALVSISSQHSEAEQRERSSSSHLRWNLLQSMGDAKKCFNICLMSLQMQGEL